MIDDLSRMLAACPLFESLEPARLSRLIEQAGGRALSFSVGRMVRQQGETYESLLLLARGVLEARIDDSSGRGMTMETLTAPMPVASAVLFSSEPRLPVSLVAMKDTDLVDIPKAGLLTLFAQEPTVLERYLSDTGDRVRFLAEKVRLFRFRSLRQRLADHVLTLSREQGTDQPHWRYGRERTAELLGVARPSLSRELSSMVDDGLLILVGRDRIEVNRSGLAACLEDL